MNLNRLEIYFTESLEVELKLGEEWIKTTKSVKELYGTVGGESIVRVRVCLKSKLWVETGIEVDDVAESIESMVANPAITQRWRVENTPAFLLAQSLSIFYFFEDYNYIQLSLSIFTCVFLFSFIFFLI